MAGVIDHPLIEIADQIVARTSPVVERPGIQHQLYSVILYIKRVETENLTPQEKELIAHRKFGMRNLTASQELADGFRDRIRIIDEYHIESASRIHELLEYGFEIRSSRTLTTHQVTILKELSKEPLMNVSQLSRRLQKSRHYVTNALGKLEESFVLSRSYIPNRTKLKLTPFSFFFRTKSYEHSKALETWIRTSPPFFLTSLVFDVTFRNGFIAFAIPTQQRAFRLFERRTRQLTQEYCAKSKVHQAKEKFWNIRFDHYDAAQGRWLIPPELENFSNFLTSIQHFEGTLSYTTHLELGEPTVFDRVDYLITKARFSAQDTLADLQGFLSRYGNNLSYNAISKRFNRLKLERIITPHLYFSGAGIEEFVGLCIDCDQQVQRQLQLLTSFFPLSFTFLTQEGIIVFIKRPTGWRDFLVRFIQELPTVFDINDLMVVNQERNYGNKLQEQVYTRWNEKRQYWEFTDEEI